MSEKLYCVVVVSKKPIKLGVLPEDPDVVQVFNEEFDPRPHTTRGTVVVTNPLLYDGANGKVNHPLRGSGETTLIAIADWLRSACSFLSFRAYEQRKLKLQEERNRSTGDK